MSGGYKKFGPTYNSTPFIRLGYEGSINGTNVIDTASVTAAVVNGELAGKFAGIGANGVKLAGDMGAGAVGLFREDLGDMTNGSERASFYFRGGQYYVAVERAGANASTLTAGKEITCDANGKIIELTSALKTAGAKALGIVTSFGKYPAGNMYANAGQGVADSGNFIGFIMYI